MPHKQTPTSPRLPTYLAGAADTAAFLMAPQAEAAVTAVTFGFGTELTRGELGPISVAPNAYGYLFAASGTDGTDFFAYLGLGIPTSSYGFFYHNSSLGPYAGLPSFFTNGTVIGGGGNGGLGGAVFESTKYAVADFTSDQLDKNIGFITSTGHWGWANVSWTESTQTLAINSAYVESVAGQPITITSVGAVPEPSRTLLALAGLGGVALRRRRRQSV